MRPQKSCISCHKRKQKCDLSYPCSRCIKIGVDCQYLNQKDVVEDINTKDIERLDKKWSKMEELVENFKSIINSPPESNNSNSSISTITISGKMPELIMGSDKRSNSSPQIIELINAGIEQELLDIYFKYHHPALPFLCESRVRALHRSQDLGDQTLISSICAISLKIHNYLKRLPLLEIDDNPYYQHTRKLLIKKKDPSLRVLQAMLLLEFMEMGHSRPFKAFCISAETIKIGHILGLHDLNMSKNPSELTEAEIESIKCWSYCLSMDILISLFHSKPSHTPNNELPLEGTIIKDLGEICKHIIPGRKEKEYFFIQFFHHMVKLKSSTIWINNALQSGSYNSKQIYKQLLELQEIMKLGYSQLSIQTEDEVLNTIHDITIDDNIFISSLVLATFKLLLSLFTNFLIYKIAEFGDEDDILKSIEHHSQARSDSIKLYKLLMLTEERYTQLLSKDLNKVVYGSHFCFCLGLEVAMLCHQSETTASSRKFITKCKIKQQEFSVFWPLIKNPLTKNQMMKVHVPDSIAPPTPDYLDQDVVRD